MSSVQIAGAAFAAFLGVWFGVAQVPDEWIDIDTKGNIFLALCVVFGTTVNWLLQRYLRTRKNDAVQRVKEREAEEARARGAEKNKKEEDKNQRLLAKAKRKEEEEKKKNPPPAPTDGSAAGYDAYRPKRAVKEKPKTKSLDAWDNVDYTAEFIKVNGDPREFGEMDKKEKQQLEMMKAYQQDPVGMEKALKQAKQMKDLKRATQGKQLTPAEQQAKQQNEAKENLQNVLKKTGVSGSVFSGKDLETPEGQKAMAEAMSRQAK